MSESIKTIIEVFLTFLKLGLTSFGGPIAHIGYFREEFVSRKKWLDEKSYADLVALCQFLPGPASSQVGMAVGLSRAGYIGCAAAWAGFTLPSAIALIVLALGLTQFGEGIPYGVLQGLKIVAVAVVAQALWGMAKSLCPDRARVSLMVTATAVVLVTQSIWSQVGVIVLAGFIGVLFFSSDLLEAKQPPITSLKQSHGIFWLAVFFSLLLGLPLAAAYFPNETLTVIDSFYRAGSLVFGGGHVVLPLLQAEVVSPGWVSQEIFLVGYGATQAVPGPLFTFAAFLGASIPSFSSAWIGGLIALGAIFIPSFLLVAGALPFWDRLRNFPKAQSALKGVNAAVVGILLAALYDPVWTSAIQSPIDFAYALVAFVALVFWKLPPWLVVIACGALGPCLTSREVP